MLALALAAPLSLAAWLSPGTTAVRVEDRLPWHGAGVWLAGDTHVHEMLDPERGLEIVDAAKRYDLDFIASTEHSEKAFDDRTAELEEKIKAEEESFRKTVEEMKGMSKAQKQQILDDNLPSKAKKEKAELEKLKKEKAGLEVKKTGMQR